jgi:hypothetical protein
VVDVKNDPGDIIATFLPPLPVAFFFSEPAATTQQWPSQQGQELRRGDSALPVVSHQQQQQQQQQQQKGVKRKKNEREKRRCQLLSPKDHRNTTETSPTETKECQLSNKASGGLLCLLPSQF